MHLIELVREINRLFRSSRADKREGIGISYPRFRRLFQAIRNCINRRPCRGILLPTPLQNFPNCVGEPQFL